MTPAGAKAGKERPILFSGPMVRAILAGTKTQTRRIVKPVRGFERHNICKPDMMADSWSVWWHGDETDRVGVAQDCPYGKPGDRLWVRETFCEYPAKHPIYRADYGDGRLSPISDGIGGPWRPSIFMFRWASRINLEIAEVRVERLQDISEEDATAEGTQEPSLCALGGDLAQAAWSERQVYSRLWKKINGPDSWDANPWLWAISFRKLEAADAE